MKNNYAQILLRSHMTNFTPIRGKYREFDMGLKIMNAALQTRYQPNRVYEWLKGTQQIPKKVIAYLMRNERHGCQRCMKFVQPENHDGDLLCPICKLVLCSV